MQVHSTRTRRGMWFMLVVVLLIASSVVANAQNPFEDAVKQLSSENVRGYLQPFADAFGANLNSGTYHSASIGEMGVSIRLDFIGMGTMIGDDEKTYFAKPPAPFDQTPVQTATLFGETGTTVTGPGGTSYQFQNGQVKTSFVPLATPQLTIGNVYGTQAVIRYVPIPEVGDFPEVNLFGIGLRHNISRYLPNAPVDIAAGFFWQTLDIGDIIEAKTFNFGAQVGKSFSVLELYGGLQYESADMTVSYTYTGPTIPGQPNNSTVSLDMEGENNFRLTAGVGLNLAILHLGADINLGKVTLVSGTVALGL